MEQAKLTGQGLFGVMGEGRNVSPPRGRRVGQTQTSSAARYEEGHSGAVGNQTAVLSRPAYEAFYEENGKEFGASEGRVCFSSNPLQEILRFCEQRTAAYHDYDFQCVNDPVLAASCRGEVTHKRLGDLGKTTLFGPSADAPHISEIDWGVTEIGHWLISVMAIVVQEFSAQGREAQKDPKTACDMGGVKYMIQPSTANAHGVYSVRLFIDSKWRYVIVDDTIPVDAVSGRPLLPTMKSGSGGMFLTLIVKAVAKVFRGYSALTISTLLHKSPSAKGLAEIMCELSGGVVLATELAHPRSEKFVVPWGKGAGQEERAVGLEKFCDAYWEYIDEMLMDVSAEVVTVPFQSVSGLKRGGVYRVLETAVAEVPGGHPKVIKLLRLHAPYLCTAWEGAWSPDSAEWREAPRLREVLCPRTELDGSFWIEYIDFLNRFEYISAVRMFTGWNELSLTGELYPDIDPTRYQFQLSHDCKVHLTISAHSPSEAQLSFSLSPTPLHPLALPPSPPNQNTSPATHGMAVLPAGTYTITPSCGNLYEFDSVAYSLRVFAQSAFVLVEKQVGLPM